MTIETQLREALAARADGLAPAPGDAYARVSVAVRTSERRRRATYAGLAAAIVAMAVLVPGLVRPYADRTATPATRTATLQLPAPGDPAWSSLTTWPTRGSLAQDQGFLDDLSGHAAALRVLYAGDIAGRRVAVLVVGDDLSRNLSLWEGPEGAPATALTEASTAGPVDSRRTLLVRLGLRPSSPLLVLARPGVRVVEVSATATVNRDGSVSRSPWTSHDLDGGVGLVRLSGAPTQLTRVRVDDYDGQASSLVGRDGSRDFPAVCLDLCTDFDQRVVDSASAHAADTLGIPRADVTSSIVWSGPVDRAVAAASGMTDAGDGTIRLVVVDSVLPNGAVLRSGLMVHSTADSASTQELPMVPIDAATAADLPIAVHGVDQRTQQTLVQIVAPRAASARLTSDAPTIYPDSDTLTVRNGSAVFRLDETGITEHRRVVTYDGAGNVIGTWPLDPPNESDPFDTARD